MKKTTENAIVKQVQAMPALVENVNKQALTTSLKVAEGFAKRHDNVIRDIKNLIATNEETATESNPLKFEGVKHFVESSYIDAKGESRPMYIITFTGFLMLTKSYRDPLATEIYLQFIDTFTKMQAEIAELKARRAAELATIKANKANPIWLPARVNSISGFHNLADVIKNELIPLAKLQKSSSPDKLYKVYAKMIKAAARVKDIKDRDLLSFDQLNLISYLETTSAALVSDFVKSGMYYKDIYLKVKKLIEDIAKRKINNQPAELTLF